MACAQCHDHKYDPLSQKEYFQLFAIFNNTADADRGDEIAAAERVPTRQKAQRRRLAHRSPRRGEVEEKTPALDAGRALGRRRPTPKLPKPSRPGRGRRQASAAEQVDRGLLRSQRRAELEAADAELLR